MWTVSVSVADSAAALGVIDNANSVVTSRIGTTTFRARLMKLVSSGLLLMLQALFNGNTFFVMSKIQLLNLHRKMRSVT